jgi:branched-chain amino acid transport system ATP-binding protein
MLELRAVEAGYDDHIVLRDVSVTVQPGTVVAILGPNGAGKTTLLRVASGLVRPRRGTVLLDGADVTKARPYSRARSGLCHIPEGRGIYPSLTVRENLALYARKGEEAKAVEQATGTFPFLGAKLRQPAGQLSGGQQRQVEIARSLMTEPPVYLIDEPTAGIDPRTSEDIYDLIAALARDSGKAILLVDQDIKSALAIADYVYVVKNGAVASHGSRAAFGGDTDALVARWLYASGH